MPLGDALQWTAAAMPAMVGGLIALSTAIVMFVLSQRAARKERLRLRQDEAMEHVLDAFRQLRGVGEITDEFRDEFTDTLLRFTWLLDGKDEIVTNWINASGVQALKGVEAGKSPTWVHQRKTELVLGLREWRLRPIRTRQVIRKKKLPKLQADLFRDS